MPCLKSVLRFCLYILNLTADRIFACANDFIAMVFTGLPAILSLNEPTFGFSVILYTVLFYGSAGEFFTRFRGIVAIGIRT